MSLEEVEEFSESQIDALLKRAEARLREANQLATSASTLSASRFPQLKIENAPKPYVQTTGDVAQAEQRSMVSNNQRALADKPRTIEDPILLSKKKKQKATSLKAWHGLPKTDLSPQLKRDLQLLNMRSVLDPKRMYKKQGKLKIPEFSQVGTLIEGPTEFFSARLRNKDRKETFVEDTLEAEKANGKFKKKYEEVQVKKQSGKKGHYNAVKAMRSSRIEKRYGKTKK